MIAPSALLYQLGEYVAFFPHPERERRVVVTADEWEELREANADRLVYREKNYYAYATDDDAPAPRPASTDEAIDQMVARGKGNRPRLAARLDAAAELVRAGRVTLDGDEAQLGPYVISAEGCTCADFVYRGGWCKHRLAVRMARHLAANGFDLPVPVQQDPAPQITPANRRLIESGAVIDAERRSRAAYQASAEAAQRRALTYLSRGAGTIPADLARRAGNVRPGVEQ